MMNNILSDWQRDFVKLKGVFIDTSAIDNNQYREKSTLRFACAHLFLVIYYKLIRK